MTSRIFAESKTNFRTSPLITPERITLEGETALTPRPSWVLMCVALFDAEEDAELGALVPRHYSLMPRLNKAYSRILRPPKLTLTQVAILFEATRYGGSLLFIDDGKGRPYFRIMGLRQDQHVDVSRIWTNAESGQIVRQSNMRIGHDQTPGAQITGPGYSRSEGREVLFEKIIKPLRDNQHQSQLGYVENIKRLLGVHDAEVEMILAQ